MRMRGWLFVLSLTLLPSSLFAQSQVPSVRDIIELTKAGLGDQVILALIEVNGSVYPSDTETMKSLKAAGVSQAVIVAMVKSGRQQPRQNEVEEPSIASPPEPQVVVVDREPAETHVREVAVPVAVPIYVAVPVYRSHGIRPDVRPAKPVEPVYWGWGGKRRPDTWKPTVADIQKDAKIPEAQRK